LQSWLTDFTHYLFCSFGDSDQIFEFFRYDYLVIGSEASIPSKNEAGQEKFGQKSGQNKKNRLTEKTVPWKKPPPEGSGFAIMVIKMWTTWK
jgi:hypothetical protein